MNEPTTQPALPASTSSATIDDFFDDGPEDRCCPRCHGVGGDPMDDYCTPCDHCGGEGYEWWK